MFNFKKLVFHRLFHTPIFNQTKSILEHSTGGRMGHVIDQLFHKLAHDQSTKDLLIISSSSILSLKSVERLYYLSLLDGATLDADLSLPKKLGFHDEHFVKYKYFLGGVLRSLNFDEGTIRFILNHIDNLQEQLSVPPADYVSLGGPSPSSPPLPPPASSKYGDVIQLMSNKLKEDSRLSKFFIKYQKIDFEAIYAHQRSYLDLALGLSPKVAYIQGWTKEEEGRKKEEGGRKEEGGKKVEGGKEEEGKREENIRSWHEGLEINAELFYVMKNIMGGAMRECGVEGEVVDRALIRIENYRKDVLKWLGIEDLNFAASPSKFKALMDLLRKEKSLDHLYYNEFTKENHNKLLIEYLSGNIKYKEEDLRCAHIKNLITDAEFDSFKNNLGSMLEKSSFPPSFVIQMQWEIEKLRKYIVFEVNYDKIGGEEKIAKMSNALTSKISKLPKLDHFFSSLSPSLNEEHHRQMFKFLLEGPRGFTGKDLKEAHSHLRLNGDIYDLFKQSVMEVVEEEGVDEVVKKRMAEALEGRRDDVVIKEKKKH